MRARGRNRKFRLTKPTVENLCRSFLFQLHTSARNVCSMIGNIVV